MSPSQTHGRAINTGLRALAECSPLIGALVCSVGWVILVWELPWALNFTALASPTALTATSPSLTPLLCFGALHIVSDIAVWFALGTLTAELVVHHAAVLASHTAVWAAGGFGALHVALLYVLFSHSFCMGVREHAALLVPRRLAGTAAALASAALVLTFVPVRWGLLPFVLAALALAVSAAAPRLGPGEWGAAASILASWAVLAWLSAVWTAALWRQVRRAATAALRGVPARVSGAPLRALLTAAGWLQCRRVRIVWRGDDPAELALAAAVLRSSEDKGAVVEAHLALPAWAPLRPVESVSGDEWRGGSAAVAALLRAMHWRERLPAIIERVCDAELAAAAAASSAGAVTAATVSAVLSRTLHELAFGEPPSDADAALWVAAASELKRELALRGRGDAAVKRAALARAADLIGAPPQNPCAAEVAAAVAGASVSHLLQPFVLSPIINVGDGLAALALASSAPPPPPRVTEALCLAALVRSPPFPLLERFVAGPGGPVPPGTHVFVLSDRIAASLPPGDPAAAPALQWLAFGAGPRACPGQALALALMAGVGARLLSPLPPLTSRLWAGHVDSGRHNDGGAGGVTLAGAAWQAATVLRVLVCCAADGVRRLQRLLT